MSFTGYVLLCVAVGLPIVCAVCCLPYFVFRRWRAGRSLGTPPHASPAVRQPPALAARLQRLGFTVRVQEQWSHHVPERHAGYAICFGARRQFPCPSCRNHDLHTLGETKSFDVRPENWVSWFAVVCGTCGRTERFSDDAIGFLGRTLDHGASLLDIVSALEAHRQSPFPVMLERVLAERESVLRAKADAAAALRFELLKNTGGATTVIGAVAGKNTVLN